MRRVAGNMHATNHGKSDGFTAQTTFDRNATPAERPVSQ